MLTDSRYCWHYHALSISRTYNLGKNFQNTDFQQSIKISLRDLLLTPQLQEEEKCACHLFQTKNKNSKYEDFLILSRDKLRSHLQSDWVINRRSKVQYCNHAPHAKSVIKPKNQWIYAKNAFCVQLSLVPRKHVNQNCTEVPLAGLSVA